MQLPVNRETQKMSMLSGCDGYVLYSRELDPRVAVVFLNIGFGSNIVLASILEDLKLDILRIHNFIL